jgi:hypothetical protein
MDRRDFTAYASVADFISENRLSHPPLTKFEVCWSCDGHGSYVNPNLDRGGISPDEMWEWGEDFVEGYFNGSFDQICDACGGNRVLEGISPEDPNFADWERYVEEWYARQAEREAEMRMGC